MPVIPERDWTVGMHTQERPGVSVGDDGVEIRVSRPGWESLTGIVAHVHATIFYPDKSVTSSWALPGGTLKGGQTENVLGWDWPGEAENGVRKALRPDSFELRFEVVQPCRARIEYGAIRYAVNPQSQVDKVA